MLASPERRLLVVRIVRLFTIVACVLFFVGVVSQLKTDVRAHRYHVTASDDVGADDDGTSGDASYDDYGDDVHLTSRDNVYLPSAFPKRYLPTLIVSRAFLLLLVLVVLLGHIPLSKKARSTLAKLTFPLQGSPWAQTDRAIDDTAKRSAALDAELQQDLSKLIGSGLLLLVSAAQELSRSISQFLLVAAFTVASIGLLNLAAAALIYNPALPGRSGSANDATDLKPSVLRERPRVPSYMLALSAAASSALQRLGSKSTNRAATCSRADTLIRPASIQFPSAASRGIDRAPAPQYSEKAAVAPFFVQVPHYAPPVSSFQPHGNPLSPQFAPSPNGRHPLATDDALAVSLEPPVSATTGVAITREPKATQESDKDVLIRMWTAQIAEQRQAEKRVDAPVPTGPTERQPRSILPAHGPQVGGRAQITAPYLSLREARARYALHKATVAAHASATPAPLPAPQPTPQPAHSEPAAKEGSRQPFDDKDDEAFLTVQPPEIVGPSRTFGAVTGERQLDVRSAPKFESMQGVLGERRGSSSSAETSALPARPCDAAAGPSHAAPANTLLCPPQPMRGLSSGTPSICISVSSTEADPATTATRMRRKHAPPALTFSSCSRHASLRSVSPDRAAPGSRPESPSAPMPASPDSMAYPQSETTRWSQPSAAYTTRTGRTATTNIGGASTAARGPALTVETAAAAAAATRVVARARSRSVSRSRSREASSAEGDRHLRERDSRYLSAVLAAIKGPEQRAQMVAEAAAAASTGMSSGVRPVDGARGGDVPPLPPMPAMAGQSSMAPPPPPPPPPYLALAAERNEASPSSAHPASAFSSSSSLPLRSPGMLSELQRAQAAALARAKQLNKKRSLWLQTRAGAGRSGDGEGGGSTGGPSW